MPQRPPPCPVDRASPTSTSHLDPPIGATFEQANRSFHEAYEHDRSHEARSAPVLILLADELIAWSGAGRTRYPLAQPAFHAIKAVAHLAVATVIVVRRPSSSPNERGALKRQIDATLERSRARADHALDDQAQRDVQATLALTLSLLDDAARPESKLLQLGESLLRLTDHATRVQLATLHDAVERALPVFSPDERRLVHVVVAGDHQARARSLGMQYFQRRFGEKEGTEERVSYGEGVATEEDALALVGTLRADRRLAMLLFGDPHRLQRDILGDATKAQLDAMNLAPIE